MRHSSEVWDRGVSIDSLDAACRFVESVWSEEHTPPSRIHGRGVQPDDQSGSPVWSKAFARYMFAHPDEVDIVSQGEADGAVVHRTGPDKYLYRYPLWRALRLLGRREHDRWTKGVPRRPFHPPVVAVLLAMSSASFDPRAVILRYADGTRVPLDMAELFCIGAARKLRGVYTETFVEWTAKSESQQKADDAA